MTLWYKLLELGLENVIKPVGSDNSIMDIFGLHIEHSTTYSYVKDIDLDETEGNDRVCSSVQESIEPLNYCTLMLRIII